MYRIKKGNNYLMRSGQLHFDKDLPGVIVLSIHLAQALCNTLNNNENTNKWHVEEIKGRMSDYIPYEMKD